MESTQQITQVFRDALARMTGPQTRALITELDQCALRLMHLRDRAAELDSAAMSLLPGMKQHIPDAAPGYVIALEMTLVHRDEAAKRLEISLTRLKHE